MFPMLHFLFVSMDAKEQLPDERIDTMTQGGTTDDDNNNDNNNNSNNEMTIMRRVLELVRQFYKVHTEIKTSHGLEHVLRVYEHACRAIEAHNQQPGLSPRQATEIKIAALLHDVDDAKYFPKHSNYENARAILQECSDLWGSGENDNSNSSVQTILSMIHWVSCSSNGNRVPTVVQETEAYHLLIPRWADRLEAVGSIGVVRCYLYNQEHNRPLYSPKSPRAQTEAQVWELATPDRFENYLTDSTNAVEDDMISHYYDKLLHVARPPPSIVRNPYLEEAAKESSRELIKVCVSFGQTGKVDVAAIEELAVHLGMSLHS